MNASEKRKRMDDPVIATPLEPLICPVISDGGAVTFLFIYPGGLSGYAEGNGGAIREVTERTAEVIRGVADFWQSAFQAEAGPGNTARLSPASDSGDTLDALLREMDRLSDKEDHGPLEDLPV